MWLYTYILNSHIYNLFLVSGICNYRHWSFFSLLTKTVTVILLDGLQSHIQVTAMCLHGVLFLNKNAVTIVLEFVYIGLIRKGVSPPVYQYP